MEMTLTLHSKSTHLTGFKYFWLKTVTGFNSKVHCARCLIGEYSKSVASNMPADDPRKLDVEPGAVFYLCGVSLPYRWENNAHLAFQAQPGAVAKLTLYNGDIVEITNAHALNFDDSTATRLFADKGKSYLTCRNFQFGAQHFTGTL